MKSPTTSDVSTGIYTAIQNLLEKSAVSRDTIASINIGTTHFVNAVIQADASKLERVAVIRLCGPFCRTPAPFVDFPPQLRDIMEGYCAYASGGIEGEYTPRITISGKDWAKSDYIASGWPCHCQC